MSYATSGAVYSPVLIGADVLHNYGHGNAGVSISWGCARYAVGLLG
jgi:D-amino-acid oxidase